MGLVHNLGRLHGAKADTEYMIRLFIIRIGEYFIYKEQNQSEQDINRQTCHLRATLVQLYNEGKVGKFIQEEHKILDKMAHNRVWGELQISVDLSLAGNLLV